MSNFHKGDRVRWNWGGNTAEAAVEDIFPRRVQRTLKGKKVTRNGSKKNPAYLLKQEDGDKILKLHSELSKA
ncbi:DUF2945 domain-containing protein [Falsirhodobacter algicola]|uniref:HVA1 family protein n=1 Tax=Falsirhodobacter algicola TaxID=2692330 RepID=A0A8J8MTE3_9RHOB|nr:DUF2945 domain-containing protein [Falsirhodobacter algicola]QUS35978.1 HVA1 family protein [Falsirhodobacter algicola]